MQTELNSIVEGCLQRLRAGQRIEDILQDYPQEAEYLRGVLEAARSLRKQPIAQPRPEAFQAGRTRMLAAAQKKWGPVSPVSSGVLSRYAEQIRQKLSIRIFGKETLDMKLTLRLALTFIFVLVMGGLLTLNVSASSLPGEPLYVVKRAWENVRLGVTANTASRQTLETQFALERKEEIQEMVAQGRQGTLELTGTLEAVNDQTWVISGLQVFVTAQTVQEGQVELNARLTAQAEVGNDGRVVLRRVRFLPPLIPLQTPAPTHTPLPTHTPGMTPTAMPPTKTTEPQITMMSPTVTMVPQTITIMPSTMTMQPPTMTMMPPTITIMPSTMTMQPPTMTMMPPTMTMQPPTMTMMPNPTMPHNP